MPVNKYATTEIFKKYDGRIISDCKTFSEKIICARVNYKNGSKKKTGLSLTLAAKRIGISINYLRLLEIGERSIPNAALVFKIEDVYGFQHGDLSGLLSHKVKRIAVNK